MLAKLILSNRYILHHRAKLCLFVFNVNDQYGSEFEDPDVPLDGVENAPSEFDTDILSDFVRGNQKIGTASQVLNPFEAVGCSSGSIFLDSAEDMTKDTTVGQALDSEKLLGVLRDFG